MPSDSLHDEDRLSMDFPESEASLIAGRPFSELLYLVATFSSLKRSDTEYQKKVMVMKNSIYHDSARATINLTLPWHSFAVEIADPNLNIVTGKLSKRMKSLNPAKPWVLSGFLFGRRLSHS